MGLSYRYGPPEESAKPPTIDEAENIRIQAISYARAMDEAANILQQAVRSETTKDLRMSDVEILKDFADGVALGFRRTAAEVANQYS